MKKIDDQLLQGLLNYLGTRPYQEVYVLISRLSQLEDCEKPSKEDKQDKKSK